VERGNRADAVARETPSFGPNLLARFASLRTTGVNGSSIEKVLNVRCIVLLDHLDRGAAVFGDVINIGPLREAKTNIAMPKAIHGPRMAIPVELQPGLIENFIKEFEIAAREDDIGCLWQLRCGLGLRLPFRKFFLRSWFTALRRPFRAIEQTLKRLHGARHAFAKANAAFAADINLQNQFAGGVIFDHRHIAKLEIFCLIRPQSRVRLEENEVVKLLGIPAILGAARALARMLRGCVIEHFVFRRAEPRSNLDLIAGFEGGRHG